MGGQAKATNAVTDIDPRTILTARAVDVSADQPAEDIGGIVFDVPDVLYDATLWRRWLFQLVTRLGVHSGYEDFDRRWNAHLADVHRGRREYAEALEAFLLDCGLTWGQVDEIEAARGIQRQNIDLHVRPLPGVLRVFDELARLGVPLAAWADASHASDKLAELLARLLPRTHFDAVLTSIDLESTQPDAACYRAMLAALRIPAPQAVYVGHDSEHLAAARAAGLRTVAVNFAPGAAADHCLTCIDDLPALVKSWSLGPRRAAEARAPLSGGAAKAIVATGRGHL